MSKLAQTLFTRRHFVAASGSFAAISVSGSGGSAEDATPPVATPDSGAWSYLDVLGTTVTLPTRPIRIAANLGAAAALWDLGIESIAVFDWTASAYPAGDHIAWGNIDVEKVVNVGDVDGNILPENLLNTSPDLILTLSYDPSDVSQIAGVPIDLAEQIGKIAPVAVVTDMASTELQLERLVKLAKSLGANLETPEIIAARESYEAKLIEFKTVTAEKPDLTSAFMSLDEDALYVAGPKGVAELQFLGALGLTFANADSAAAGDFWETLSVEQAILYPSDLLFSDVYSVYMTLAELQAHPIYSAMPAVAAGQVGLWQRDFPVNYVGITAFLETILVTLRPAVKVIL